MLSRRELVLGSSAMLAGQGAPQFRLVDATQAAGIDFRHNSGAFGEKYLPETLGAGCAFLDYDSDGWQDILLVNGMDWPGHKRGPSTLRLYRNNRNGTFTDVTRRAGLDVEMYGMGVAIGDYNNDGFPDLFVSCVGQSRLFENTGRGTFMDVTERSGLAGRSGFSSSALWFDYDRDGLLDLFVCNYVKWSPEQNVRCSLDGKRRSYCTPEAYRGSTCWLFRNRGGGRFEDVTAKAGLFDSSSKSLGVTMFDYDLDGWPDLFVANDTQPNKLYRNMRNGTFKEEGMQAGVAYGEDGVARGAMGADAADYDASGRPHLLIGNFSNQMLGLYHNEGNGLFVDEAPASTVGRASLLTLAFGVFFFDYDLDGYPDIFTANGHIEEEIGRVQPKIQYKEAPLLFHNLGKRRFESVAAKMGPAFNRPIVARRAGYADIDHDG